MNSEFDLIRDYFAACGAARDDVVLGVGDDAALTVVPPGRQLVMSMDTLVAGVHFLAEVDPAALGHKALAVNLSDLAAMGAEPAWATLALTLPTADRDWLTAFSAGFCALAREYGVALVGGDTTRGPLSVTVQVHGFIAPGQAFLRSAAQPGDLVHVTGTLGDAALALLLQQDGPAAACRAEDLAYLRGRLDRPTPRLAAARQLQGRIHAAIDLSDGLAADLGHVLAASGVGAIIHLDRLPMSAPFRRCTDALLAQPSRHRLPSTDPALAGAALAIAAGDDYELCFTAPRGEPAVSELLSAVGCACIGEITATPGLRCLLGDGSEFVPARIGYDHFADAAPAGR